MERCDSLYNQRCLCRLQLLLGRFICSGICLRPLRDDILIEGIQEILCRLSCRDSYRLFKGFTLGRGHLSIQACDTVCKRCQSVLIFCAESDIHHELFHGNRRLAFQRPCIALLRLCNADRIHNDKVVFIFCS